MIWCFCEDIIVVDNSILEELFVEITYSMILGYLLGCISPASLISKIKKVDLRKEGTGNVGGVNTGLVLGKRYGILVMVMDILKGFAAFRIARRMFPKIVISGLAAGLGAVLGHVFPVYMKFMGGKGLAAFAGMVLAYDPQIFGFLLVTLSAAILIINYSWAMPIGAGLSFPVLAYLKSRSLPVFLISAAAGSIVVCRHWSNIGKAYRGEDNKIREYIKTEVLHLDKNK